MVTHGDKVPNEPSDTKEHHDIPQEPPPSYSAPTESLASGSSSSTTKFKTKPTNLLALSSECGSIKGQFVIDPALSIPPSMLPPLGEGETEADRKNLTLKSKHDSIRAEIWLLGSLGGNDTKSRRSTIMLCTENGSITAQLQTVDNAPFSLTATSPHGSIRLDIPRSFQGLLSISTRHGSISLSDAILENATQLSQLEDTRRYFVGDFSLFGEGEWLGDQMELDSKHGSIRLKYVEEMAEGEGRKGLWSWLLGR